MYKRNEEKEKTNKDKDLIGSQFYEAYCNKCGGKTRGFWTRCGVNHLGYNSAEPL